MAVEPTGLGGEIQSLMDERNYTIHDVAEGCGVTYQTIKNLLDGRSTSPRVVTGLIRFFGLEEHPARLRRLLLAFLVVLFEDDDGARYLRCANLLPDQ